MPAAYQVIGEVVMMMSLDNRGFTYVFDGYSCICNGVIS